MQTNSKYAQVLNQYDHLFHRKEEVLLKVDCNSSSDESVDVVDSSESDKSRFGKSNI